MSKLKLDGNCTICAEAKLEGDVTVGAGTVIHPRAEIFAVKGPIVIGENNLFEERCRIINNSDCPMSIGSNNVFEVCCTVESCKVGDNNIVETLATVGPKVELSNGCIVGSGCNLELAGCVPENTSTYGKDCLRRRNPEKPMPQISQLEFLKKALANFHYLVGSKK